MRHLCFTLALMWPAPAPADGLRVVADIAPVHSLVATVMGGTGAPALLLEPGQDPHHHQLRPSQARALANADLVVWMGDALTPWLEGVLEETATDADQLELLAVELMPQPTEGAATGDSDHAETGARTGHDHGALDPHAWLDPLNGARFLDAIAGRLAEIDPENAAIYRANASDGAARLEELTEGLRAELRPASGVMLIPLHDAIGYFLTRFDLGPAAALAGGDAAPPGAARLAEIRSRLAEAQHACLFTEPGAGTALVEAIRTGPDVPVLTLDPLGAMLEPGPGLYETLIRQLAATVVECAVLTGAS